MGGLVRRGLALWRTGGWKEAEWARRMGFYTADAPRMARARYLSAIAGTSRSTSTFALEILPESRVLFSISPDFVDSPHHRIPLSRSLSSAPPGYIVPTR